jgi:hypothetical protein
MGVNPRNALFRTEAEDAGTGSLLHRVHAFDRKPPGEFSKKNFDDINAYIDKKMTATFFSEIEPKARNSELITSELVYYWLTVYNIPFEVETWHLNRLFTLIRIASIKQAKPKKMSRSDIARRNRELNAQRKAQLGTKG